jgi:hypothetical protein
MAMGVRERNKQEVVNAAVSIAQRNNWNPQDLVAIVSYETAGKFNPWQAGPVTQWGQHRGLFQWGEPQQKQYGVTRTMSIAEQMEAGARYLADRGVKPGDGLLAMYAAVNAGHASKVNATDENNGGRPGTVSEKVFGEEMRDDIADAKELVSKYANPSTMNGFSAVQQDIIDGVTRVSNPNAVATPSPRPDPNAPMAAPVSPVTRGTLPDITSAPGGLFDYSRAAADMTGEFPGYEAEKNLSRSLAGITPSVTTSPGGLLSPAGLAGQYGQYQPASGNAWNNQPTVNERMASPRTPTMEQQRLADAVRQSVAPQVASAPGGLFQSTGAFNNVNQARPSGSFSPSSPFGVAGLPAASGISSPVSQLGREAVQSLPGGISKPSPYSGTGAANATGPMSTSSPQGKAVSTAYQNYAASRMAAPSTPAPSGLAAAYGAAQYAPARDEPGQLAAGTPMMPSTASSATQANPAMEAPRTVAPRQVTPYSPPAPVQPAMTPERAKALGMVATPNVPGAYMPNVAGNPLQVARDQMGHIARNPLESLFNMALGTLQGGVFHSGVGNMLQSAGGLFGGGQAQSPANYSVGGQGQFGTISGMNATPSSGGFQTSYGNGQNTYTNSWGVESPIGNTGSRATPT